MTVLMKLRTGNCRRASEIVSRAEEERYKKLLQRCRRNADLGEAREVYAGMQSEGYHIRSTYLGNLAIQMFQDCRSIHDARNAFDAIRTKNVFSCNLMITAYAKNRDDEEALKVFEAMEIAPNAFVFSSALAACANLGDLERGRRIHERILQSGDSSSDVGVHNALVSMYTRCGSLHEGRQVFERMQSRNLVSWNCIISAYVQCNQPREALNLYNRMRWEEAGLLPNSFIFASVLTACANLESLEEGRQVQQHIVEARLIPDAVVQNAVINMLAKCGNIQGARDVLQVMRGRNVCSWTSVITACSQLGFSDEAFELYEMMQRDGVLPNATTLSSLLSACRNLDEGERFHQEVMAKGLHLDVMVQTSLIGMHARCGNLSVATSMFEQMGSRRDMVTWSGMISAYEQSKLPTEALRLYELMLLEGVQPNQLTFGSMIQACTRLRDVFRGRQVHAQLLSTGMKIDNALRLVLVNMYWKCHSLDEARQVFEEAEESRDTMLWTAMIKGYAERGCPAEALELFEKMKHQENVQPDAVTFAAVLAACSNAKNLEGSGEGCKVVLRQLTPDDLSSHIVGTGLLNMYAKFGRMKDAKQVFDRMEDRNVCAWTSLLRGYVRNQENDRAAVVFHSMDMEGVEPTPLTYASFIPACTGSEGRAVHQRVKQLGLTGSNVLVDAALASMYCKAGNEQEVKQVFDGMRERPMEAWNMLMAVYSKNSKPEEAELSYRRMVQEGVTPSSVTFTILFGVCSQLKKTKLSEEVEQAAAALGLLQGPVGNAQINMYARLGLLSRAKRAFESMGVKNVVTWSTIIAAHTQAGMDGEALELFKRMDVEADEVTMALVLSSCRKLGCLEAGVEVHRQALAAAAASASPFPDLVGTALINLYAKCSSMEQVRDVFKSMARTSAAAWTSVMTASAKHCQFEDVLELYSQMQCEGVAPDHITFISILASQSQAGSLEAACTCFVAISRDHGLAYVPEHYQCLVDLLARSGRLHEAEEMIEEFGDDDAAWKSLLSACRDHEDSFRGRRAAEQIQKIVPGDGASYVLLSQLYASPEQVGVCSDLQDAAAAQEEMEFR